MTVGHSDPKKKYHAIYSVYYIFSIQVYITFLSIQVHTVIHIVLLCLSRCWLILGHNFIFSIRQTFMKHEYPSVLVGCGCSSGGEGGVGGRES